MGPRGALARITYAAAGLALTGGPAYAGESQFGANVSTRLAYSDNIALAPEGSEQDQRLAELGGGFTFSRSQGRLDADVSYQLQGVFYDNATDLNEIYHTLDASSRLALVSERFYLDTFGIYDQAIVDPTGKFAFNKLAITGNRTDFLALGASPNVALAFGANIRGEARVSISKITYDDPALDESTERLVTFNLGNTEARSGGSWGVSYDNEHYDYELSSDVEFQLFSLQLGFWPTSTVQLFTTQGLESDYTLVFDQTPGAESPGLDAYYWNVGAQWRPSDRNKLTVTSGERSFGRSETFSWDYHAGKGGINLTYSEEPATFVREQLRSMRRTGELAPIDSLDGPNGNTFFLQKRLGLAFVLERRRTSAGLRLFDDRRFDIVEATVAGEPGQEMEKYRGFELDWQWKMSTLASLNVSAQRAQRRSTINKVDDQLDYLAVEWGRRVGRQNQLSLRLARERSRPGAEVVGSNSYNEHQLSIGISRWFASDTTAGLPKRFGGANLNGSAGNGPAGNAPAGP